MRKSLLVAALLAPSLLVTARGARADELPAGCGSLGAPLTDHSCFHASHGPFSTVAARGLEEPLETLPPVDTVHTFFQVLLPTPLVGNAVSYRVASAARAGLWAISVSDDVVLIVTTDAGETLSPILVHATDACAELARLEVFRLPADRVRIGLASSTRDRAIVVLENVNDFVAFAGRDGDGDGYGDPTDALVTVCAPPPGYVLDARDCDDGDAAISPAATERCDGLDRNCNGVPDDAGLPCRGGLGACGAEGTWGCPAPNQAAVCQAPTPAPGAELCDGVDSDCDGTDDLDETALCDGASIATPRCIRSLGVVRCGCEDDADCGSASSGQVCDPGSRTCVAGCMDVPGRNGCPPGEVCSSRDPASAGRCGKPAPICDGDPGCVGDPAGPRCVGAGTTAAQCGCAPSDDCGAERACVEGRCRAAAASRAEASKPADDGCGCQTAGTPPAGSAALAALLATALLAYTRRRRSTGSAMVAAMVCAAACGGETREVESPPVATCTPRLSPSLVAHGCSHGRGGPFVDVVAAGDAAGAPDVSRVHQTYRVAFASGDQVGRVRYVAARDGEHVVFGASVTALSGLPEIVQATGAPCDALPNRWIVALRKGVTYDVLVQADANRAHLFIEHAGAFGEQAVDRRCDEGEQEE